MLPDPESAVILGDMDSTWDCTVVGAGAGGLSAALVLGRARRSTLVVDAGQPSNAPAHGIGGVLGHDGRPPADFYAIGREEVAAYPSVEMLAGDVVGGRRCDLGFELELADGTRHHTKRVVLATGMEYRYPKLPGLTERWGGAVFHCPFCHGWEVRDRRLGVLDRGDTGVHRALLLQAWSDDVTLLTDGPDGLDDDEQATLAAHGVAVDDRRVSGVRGPGRDISAVMFTVGSERPLDALLVPVTLHQRSALAQQLGAATHETMVASDAVDVDAWMQSSVPGLSAVGDISTAAPSVAAAIAAGSAAAAGVVRSLIEVS